MGLVYAALTHCKDVYKSLMIVHEKLEEISAYFIKELSNKYHVTYYNDIIDTSKNNDKVGFFKQFSNTKPNIIIYGFHKDRNKKK